MDEKMRMLWAANLEALSKIPGWQSLVDGAIVLSSQDVNEASYPDNMHFFCQALATFLEAKCNDEP